MMRRPVIFLTVQLHTKEGVWKGMGEGFTLFTRGLESGVEVLR